MATKLGKIVADFTSQLATKISVGGTTATLQSATDDDGNALASGRYFFTIDGDNTRKEHISADLSGTALTNIKSISRAGVESTGVAREHRVGATISITDFAHIKYLNDLLDGTTNLNASTPLEYDGTATINADNQLATKDYVDNVAIAGAPDSTTTVKGLVEKATTAEIDAGTATGGSGPLGVSPDQLAASIYNTQLPSSDQKAALVGTSGTPSTSNKYVTADDVTEANTASKVPRRDSNGDVLVAATPTNDNAAAPKNYVDDLRFITVPLGESMTGATTPEACVLINDLDQPYIDGYEPVGHQSNNEKLALKIIPRTTLTVDRIKTIMALNSAAQDGVEIVIQGDSAGDPDGSTITNGTSATVSSSSLSNSEGTPVEFTFSTPPTLTADTTYWIVLQKTGAVQASNYDKIIAYRDTDKNYAAFEGKFYNGGSWAAQGMMGLEIVPATGGSYSLWKADADHANEMMQNVHGFCTTTGSAGDDGQLYVRGKVPGFSSFQQFADYYLTTTAGDIDPDNTQGQYVGFGISTTELALPEGKKTGATIDMADITTGFGNTLYKTPIRAFADGEFIVVNENNATAVSDCIVYLQNIPSTNYLPYYLDDTSNGQRSTITIPVRKGQYIEVTSMSSGQASIYFTPQI